MPQPQFGREMHTRVPPRVQKIMAQKLERSVPGYMKQYVGPYMQQQVVHPVIGGQPVAGPVAGPPPGASVAPTLHGPTGESWRQSHFLPTNAPQPIAPPPAQMPGQPAAPADPYTFITEPAAPKQGFRLPGGGSLVMRAAFAAGGLLVLIILFSVIKNLVVGPSKFTAFLPVAQDQQQIAHLTKAASQQQSLPVTTENFIATAQLTVPSNQSGLLQYLANNHYKVNPKSLVLKVNPSLDTQLTAAAANTTYDETFRTIMAAQLNTYINDLKHTYAQTTGTKGRALLSSDYDQAQLLLTQLQQPAS
jgi:hypothetical protein